LEVIIGGLMSACWSPGRGLTLMCQADILVGSFCALLAMLQLLLLYCRLVMTARCRFFTVPAQQQRDTNLIIRQCMNCITRNVYNFLDGFDGD